MTSPHHTRRKAFDTLGIGDYAPFPLQEQEYSKELAPLFHNLSVVPVLANHYQCHEDWVLQARRVPNSYWSLITAGDGMLQLAGQELPIKTGHLIIFPARVEHAITPSPGSRMAMINVKFDARIYNLLDVCALVGLQGLYPTPSPNYINFSRELARLYALKPPGWRGLFASMVRLLLFELILNSSEGFDSLSMELGKLARIYPALELIEDRFTDPQLSTENVAQRLKISQVYTRKLFQELFGISPVRFIQNKRIDHACHLLHETGLPIKEIAAKSGFQDLAFFYRIFQRNTGMTPAKYRATPQF